jgi:ABC-type transport system involved in multi-copper enzyme maturation permease subunit
MESVFIVTIFVIIAAPYALIYIVSAPTLSGLSGFGFYMASIIVIGIVKPKLNHRVLQGSSS